MPQLNPNWSNDPNIRAVSHVHHACLMGASFLKPETAGFERMTPEIRERLSTLVDQWTEATRGLTALHSELLAQQVVKS